MSDYFHSRRSPDDDCTDEGGHRFVCSDENEEISYCQYCGADGNA